MNPTHNQGSPKEQVFNLFNGPLHKTFGQLITTEQLGAFKYCSKLTYSITKSKLY